MSGPTPAVVGCSRGGVRHLDATDVAPDTVFRIASLTKPVTAVATVLACRDASTPLDTRVTDVLPQLGPDLRAHPDLTVAQLLAQTSGLSARVTGADVAALGEGDDVHLEAARLVLRAGSARAPGERWEYDNGNYFVAGAIVAELTGTTYEDAVAALVLRPWGLDATGFAHPTDAAPYPRGRRPSGGLCSTATDLLTFGEHLLGDADLLAGVSTRRTASSDSMAYGLGWALGPSGQMYLNGRLPGYRSALVLVPDHRLVAVGLAADTDALPMLAARLSDLQRDLTGDDLLAAIDAFAA